VLLTGAVPIRAPRDTFLLAFGATFLLQRLTLQRLARGRAPAVLSTVFDLVRMQANARATLTLVIRKSATFRVTSKGRVGDDRRRGRVPVLLEVVLVLNLVAAVWFAASAAGVTPLHYGIVWAVYGAAFWLVVNCGLVATAAVRVRDERFAADRRAAVRFDVHLDARLDHAAVAVDDISLTGARVVVREGVIPPGFTGGELCVQIGRDSLAFAAVVQSRRPITETGHEALGLEFAHDQDDVRARLALALFHADAVPILFAMPHDAVAELSAAERSSPVTAA